MTKGIFTLFPAAERLFASKAKDDSKSVQANKHSRHPSTWVVFIFHLITGSYQRPLTFGFLKRATAVPPIRRHCLCALACSLVPNGAGTESMQADQSQHGRDGHAPFFCGSKSNFKGTMVSLDARVILPSRSGESKNHHHHQNGNFCRIESFEYGMIFRRHGSLEALEKSTEDGTGYAR